MVKVYTASKLDEAPRWRALIEEWPEVEFTARWPTKHVQMDIPDNHAAFASVFWEQDLEDVAAADVVLVYGNGNQKLRGALIEAGIALALGRTVVVVGDHADYGTWQYHPNVRRVATLEDARRLFAVMDL